MLVIEECKNTRAVTIFIRGGNKMVIPQLVAYCGFLLQVGQGGGSPYSCLPSSERLPKSLVWNNGKSYATVEIGTRKSLPPDKISWEKACIRCQSEIIAEE